MNKVTMQDIADALGISRVTVWKVFNNYTNVSASVREKVLLKAKELGYTKGLAEVDDGVLEKNVSLIVSRPNSSTFWTTIIHRAAQELSLHNVNLMYTYVPSNFSEDFRMPSVLTNGTVQGAIVLNVYDKRMIRQICQLGIPKVFLDTVPERSDGGYAVADFRAVRPDLGTMDDLEKLGQEIGVSVKCQKEEIFDQMHRI